MRKQTLVEVIKEHGHNAWFISDSQLGVHAVGEKPTIISNSVKSVREWLGY